MWQQYMLQQYMQFQQLQQTHPQLSMLAPQVRDRVTMMMASKGADSKSFLRSILQVYHVPAILQPYEVVEVCAKPQRWSRTEQRFRRYGFVTFVSEAAVQRFRTKVVEQNITEFGDITYSDGNTCHSKKKAKNPAFLPCSTL